MNNVTDLSPEKTLDHSPISNPFQLSKTKGPIKLIPLHAALRGETGIETGHGLASLSESHSATSSTSSIGTSGTSDIMSPKSSLGSSLGENPFSFKVQKLGNANLSRSSSMTNSLISDSQGLVDHQKEILKLKKNIEMKNEEIESKDAKLSSSVKSIKQFWSPELKKERVLRKEEAEKSKLLKEQFENENKKYEDTNTKLLECQQQLLLLTTQCEEQKRKNDISEEERKRLKAEFENKVNLQDTLSHLNDENDKKSTKINELENIISENEKNIEKYKQLEAEYEGSNTTHIETKKILERYKERTSTLGQSVEEYKNEIKQLGVEVSRVGDLLSKKDELYEAAKGEYEEMVNEVERRVAEKEEEYKKLQEQVAVLKLQSGEQLKKSQADAEHQNLSKEKVKELQENLCAVEGKLAKKDDLHQVAKHEHTEKIKEVEDRFAEKKKELNKLQDELSTVEDKLSKKEDLFEVIKQEYTEKIQEVEQILSEKEEKYNQLQDELSKVKDALSEKEKLCEAAKHEHTEKIKEVEGRFAEKEEEYMKLQDEEEKLDMEIKNLEDKVNCILTSNAATESTLRDLESEEKMLREKLEQNEEKLCQKDKDHEEEKEILLRQNKDMEQKLLQTNEKMYNVESHIAELQDELQKARSTITASDEATTDLNLKTKEVHELTLKYNKLNKFLKDRQEALDTSCGEANELKEKNEEYILTISQLKEKNQEHTSAIDGLKEKNQEHGSTIHELKERNQEYISTIQELKEKNEEYVLTNNQLKEKNEEYTISNDQLKEKNEEYTLANNELKEKSQEYTTTIKQFTKKNQEVILASTKLEGKNEEYIFTIDELKAKNQQFNKAHNKLKEKSDQLTLTVNQLKVRNEESILTIKQLEEKNEEFISAINELKEKNQKMLVDKSEKEKMEVEREKEELVPMKKQKMQVEAKEEENVHQKLIDKQKGPSKLENILKEEEETNEENVKESQSEISAEQPDVRKVQRQNQELVKEIAFLKLKINTIEKQRSVPTGDEKQVVATKKNVWDELSKKDSRIEELEKLIKEKGRQLAARKTKTSGKIDENVDEQVSKLKTDIEQKVTRITLLEETLREMVGLAKKRENIMARYAEVYEEVQTRYEEADREYSRICFERNITNIKNALLILIICEREALISSMKVSHKSEWEELFTLRQERFMNSISELDTQIANLESQSAKARRADVNKMKQEKEKYVGQLKELNNARVLKSTEEKVHSIASELRTASPEEVYEAVRHISQTYELLEAKIEELMSFLRERNAELLKDITDVPTRSIRPEEVLQKLPKDELIKELSNVEVHSSSLQKFVENLLSLLEGDS